MTDKSASIPMQDAISGKSAPRTDYFGAAVFGVLTATAFIGLQLTIESLHIVTSNGLWKSMTLTDFMANPGWATVDRSNFFLFPLHAAFGFVYDALGIFPGERWKQMGLTNALFGGAAAAIAYAFAFRWTGNRPLAALATCAYVFSGFFLLHGITNEDIMPAHMFALLATLLAAEWFGYPTLSRIVIVAMIFSLGWLIEWRVMFPPLPAFIAALLLAPGRFSTRIIRPPIFISAMFFIPTLIATVHWFDTKTKFIASVDYFFSLIWTGKGVGSGWGGFSTDKLWILASGISESVFGGRYLNDPNWLYGPEKTSTLIGLALVATMAATGLVYVYPRLRDPVARSQFVVFYGLLLGGAVFNSYSQPGDPQMQINVMLVALPGWVLLLEGVMSGARRFGVRWAGWIACVAIVCIPFIFSYTNMISRRGSDSRDMAYIREIQAGIDMTRTVFVIHGFDGMLTWMSLATRNNVPNVEKLVQAPSTEPKFKWIDIVRATIEHPEWTGEEHAEDVIRQIDLAIGLGYRVVTPVYWNNDDAYWVRSFAGVASKSKALTIRTLLHRAFEAVPDFDAQNGNDFLELKRLR